MTPLTKGSTAVSPALMLLVSFHLLLGVSFADTVKFATETSVDPSPAKLILLTDDSSTSPDSRSLMESLADGVTTSDNESEIHGGSELPDYLRGKHPSLRNCSLMSLDPGEYSVLPNGSLSVEPYGMTFNSSHFFVTDGLAYICEPTFGEVQFPKIFEPNGFNLKSADLSEAGLIVSMICLLLHLVVFAVVPDMRNLPGCNLAALCLSLLLSYGLFMSTGRVQAQGSPDLCFAVGLLSHFFLLSSFIWMAIMSFDVYLSLVQVCGSLRASSTRFRLKKFAAYGACAFGVALAFALLGVVADTVEGAVPEEYRPRFKKQCWFSGKQSLLVFFAAPVITLTCLNFLFFVLSACTIHRNRMRPDVDDRKSALQRNYLTYFRLSVIMGVTWMVGIVAAVVHTDWLWVLFVALNTLQGLYIFLAFTCNRKVVKFFRQKVLGGRRPSEQTLSPTFQSYCFYANSIEKDLDKVVDGKSNDSKDVIDTVVIHL